MAIDFPCFIKRKNIKIIGKIFFLNKNPLYGYLRIKFDFFNKAIELLIVKFYFYYLNGV